MTWRMNNERLPARPENESIWTDFAGVGWVVKSTSRHSVTARSVKGVQINLKTQEWNDEMTEVEL